jgi:hypothetical protein
VGRLDRARVWTATLEAGLGATPATSAETAPPPSAPVYPARVLSVVTPGSGTAPAAAVTIVEKPAAPTGASSRRALWWVVAAGAVAAAATTFFIISAGKQRSDCPRGADLGCI